MAKRRVYLNGRILAEEKACVSVFDRGLNYGDGVFETIKAWNGRPAFLGEHMARLKSGVKALGMTLKSIKALEDDVGSGVIEKLLARNNLSTGESYVRVTVTRGVGGSGHTPPRQPNPTMIIVVRGMDPAPMEFLKKRGVKAVTLAGPGLVMAGLKSLNFLPNIMGKMEALKKGVFEGIFVQDDVVLEGTSTNVFTVKGGVVSTPPVGTDINVLPGITRQVVLEIAGAEGLKAREERMTVKELAGSDEAFLTNSILEVVPLINVDGTGIGTGSPGPVTRLIQRVFRDRVRSEPFS